MSLEAPEDSAERSFSNTHETAFPALSEAHWFSMGKPERNKIS
jgi:hypothetical protein